MFQPLPRGSHAASAAPGGSSLPHQCFALDGPMLRPKYPLPSCASASAGSVNAAAAITATNTCFSLLIERLLSSFFDRYGTSLRTSSRLRQSFERGTDAVGHRDACRQPLDGGERFLLAVAEPDQRMDHVGGGFARRRGARLDELALQLEQQPLGGFLADTGHFDQAARFLHRHRLGQVGARQPGQHRERGARTDARDADQLAERRALLGRREAVQRVRVLAHHEMREQAHGLAGRRQLVEGAHRHVELVGDAADVHQHLRRVLRREPPGQPADQTSLPLRTRKPFVESAPSLPPWAWQIAQASASAASGAGSPGRASRRRTMCCTCRFLAWPLPTTDCLTWSAVYSATGRPASTAAQIAVPRACPSASVDCGLALTNTISTATSPGACAAMIPFSPSRIAFSLAARSPAPDLTQPLVT